MFSERINNRQSGILLYGITPPKAHHTQEKLQELAAKRLARLSGLKADGLVIYDLQDESSRISEERPFPFYQTVDPYLYATETLSGLDIHKIIYRSVGKYQEEELTQWIRAIQDTNISSVFVGAPSPDQRVSLKLPEAYEIWKRENQTCILGAVTIPERHSQIGNEHLRILGKFNEGCSFFISQCVYNVEYTKTVVSDLYYHAQKENRQLPTIIFTITTCGSKKTLDFLNWLGIHVPGWLKNELYYSHDILSKSIDLSIDIAYEIIDFCTRLGIPCGLNVESVSVQKDEVEASEYLLKKAEHILQSAGIREVGIKTEETV